MTQPPPPIPREGLADALRHTTDPLAPEALSALVADGPHELPVWASDRVSLQSVYADRVELASRGEGPATRGSDEYVEALGSAPDRVEEVGWASGEWFYVALMHAGTVLAICAVARAVWRIADVGPSGWDVFGTGSGFKDVDLIKNALDVLADSTDPHLFRAVRVDEVAGSERLDADAWYVAKTATGARAAALDHARGHLFLRVTR